MDSWTVLAAKVRNWGRWGADDQLGTLNLITPEVVREAVVTVRSGVPISLSIPIDGDGPLGSRGYRRNPVHIMSVDGGDESLATAEGGSPTSAEARLRRMYSSEAFRFNDDWIMMPLQTATQWDALCHAYYGRQLFNGFPATAVNSFGASRDGIDVLARAGQVVGRGLLVDLARARGLDRLPPRAVINADEIETALRLQGSDVIPGDILVLRTGWWSAFGAGMPGETWAADSPGLEWRVAEWLWTHDIAAVAADNIAVEVLQSDIGVNLPLHMLALRDMGMTLGEIWNLEELSVACAADGRYAFLLTAPALNVTGGAGTPVNPIAIR